MRFRLNFLPFQRFYSLHLPKICRRVYKNIEFQIIFFSISSAFDEKQTATKMLITLTIIFAAVFWLYKRLSGNEDESFEALGIAYSKPLPVVGNILPLLTRKEGIIHYLERVYWEFKDKK